MAARIIRKYPNRRLYDTTAGRYVNLEEIAALVRQGAEIQVLDAKTGKDVTRVVLTQIIVDEAKDGGAALPLEFLRQLIVATDHAGQEFLKTAFDAYRQVQHGVESFLTPKPAEEALKTRKKRQK